MQHRYGIYNNSNSQCSTGSDTQQQRSCMPRRNSEPWLLHERRNRNHDLCMERSRAVFNNHWQPIGGSGGGRNKHLFPDGQQHGFGMQHRYGIYNNGNG